MKEDNASTFAQSQGQVQTPNPFQALINDVANMHANAALTPVGKKTDNPYAQTMKKPSPWEKGGGDMRIGGL